MCQQYSAWDKFHLNSVNYNGIDPNLCRVYVHFCLHNSQVMQKSRFGNFGKVTGILQLQSHCWDGITLLRRRLKWCEIVFFLNKITILKRHFIHRMTHIAMYRMCVYLYSSFCPSAASQSHSYTQLPSLYWCRSAHSPRSPPHTSPTLIYTKLWIAHILVFTQVHAYTKATCLYHIHARTHTLGQHSSVPLLLMGPTVRICSLWSL